MIVALFFALCSKVREYLVDRWRLKTRLNYRYVSGDVEWNPKNTLRYPAICFFAGFFAGLFGVGGGIVKGPLMLEMGEGFRYEIRGLCVRPAVGVRSHASYPISLRVIRRCNIFFRARSIEHVLW